MKPGSVMVSRGDVISVELRSALSVSCRAMNRLLLIIVTMLCMAAFNEPIQACQCREYGTPICAQFWRSDAVFLGQVIDIKPLKNKPDNVYTYLMVRFVVEESFRGVSGPRVSVATAPQCAIQSLRKVSEISFTPHSMTIRTNSSQGCVPAQLWRLTSTTV